MNKRINNEKDSYNQAFKLAQILNKHKNTITNIPDEITIYPHSWYNNHFELMVRNKDKKQKTIIDTHKLLNLIKKYNKGWKLQNLNNKSIIEYQNQSSMDCETPLRLEFIE